MKVFKVNEVFKDEKCISGKAAGSFFRNEVKTVLAQGPVIMDFEGIEVITQEFSDEFLGPILEHHGQDIFRTLKFKNCSEEVQTVILSTAHRFLSDTKAVS